MAIAMFSNPGVRISGRVGNLVFRQCGKRTVVSPYRRRSPARASERQLEVRQRFQLASTYARAALSDPVQAKFYARLAKAKGKPVYALAVGDYFNPPRISLIEIARFHGHAGDRIVVLATDDAGVTRVAVTVKDETGAVLEQGEATGDGCSWDYTLKKDVPPGQPLTIEATAYDRPNNTGTKTVPWVPSNGREASPPSRTTPSLIT